MLISSSQHAQGSRHLALHAWLPQIANTAFLVGITLSGAISTEASRIVIEPLRIIALALALGLTVHGTFFQKNFSVMLSLGLLVWLAAYGLFVGEMTGGTYVVQGILGRSMLIVTVGVLCLGSNPLDSRALLSLLVISSLVAVITFLCGGLKIDNGLPRFVFFNAANDFVATPYSQGSTMFYGAGAVAAFYFFARKSWASMIPAFVFMGLSGLSGARGEFASVFVAILWALRGLTAKFIFFVGVIVAGVLLAYFVDLNRLVVWQRFQVLGQGEYFGSRSQLFNQSFQLMADCPWSLLWGGGFGFFQSYYNFGPGQYPHNVLLESLLVFGLPQTLVLIVLIIRGFLCSASDAMSAIFILYAVMSMESGSIVEGWAFMTMCLVYAGIGLESFVENFRWKRA